MRKNVLIIGAGGVAKVVAHKCAQNNDILGDINIASKTIDKCYSIIDSINKKNNFKIPKKINAYALNALDIEKTIQLINRTNSKIVINVGNSFLNMSILRACIETKVAYIDTAIHEDPEKVCENPPWYSNYEWKHKQACEDNEVTAILGAGFDPGVVNAYVAIANEYFDNIDTIDIIDINDGNHGFYFATNFDPEINFREFTGRVLSWQNNQWQVNKMFEISRKFDLPVVNEQKVYLSGHDEIHSLSKNIKCSNIRFWMGFSDHYINVFTVLNNLGLLSEKPVKISDNLEVVPLKVIKAILPDPASLAPNYKGRTFIGDLIKGSKNGKQEEILIYNVLNHQDAFFEVESQGIAYTAGVPAAAAAILIARGDWDVKKMVNIEQLDPKPFINLIGKMGLKTYIKIGREEPRLWT